MGITQLEAVPDPGLEIMGWGGGRSGHPDPYIKEGEAEKNWKVQRHIFFLFITQQLNS